MSYTCYLSLGANLGQREASIIEAMRLLQASEKIQLIAVSSLYETPPWGKLDQPAFINAAAAVKTELAPLELLQICQSIEKQYKENTLEQLFGSGISNQFKNSVY